MLDKNITLCGMGHGFPETVLDNPFFNELDIGSDAAWIEDRVGIKERRSILTKDEIKKLRRGEITRAELLANGRIATIAQMVKEPWAMALSRSKVLNPKVDTVIAGTSIPDWDIPANACAVAGSLGIAATAFDVNSACSTFVVNLHVARGLISAGQANCIGIFNCDRYTTRIDYADRKSCVLFGDSAAAGLVQRGRIEGGLELLDTVIHSDPNGFDQVILPDGGVFSQNGQVVQKFAVTRTLEVTNEILRRNGLSASELNYLVCHQANARMLEMVTRKLGLRDDQHWMNVQHYGNQGATGAPTSLSMNWDKLRKGDTVCVTVVGSGLTWGSALFRAV